jgi:hypothetical protein
MEKKRKTKDYDMGLNERLHEMDFYSLLLNKVEEGAKFSVIQRIGEA